jgi:polysaccharide export outer membrane protein
MKRIFLFALISIVLTSCISRKRLTYLNDTSATNKETVFELKRNQYKVQINDILNITIHSFDEETAKVFNSSTGLLNLNNGDLIFYLNGSSVDVNGFIQLPVIGQISAVGKTVDGVKSLLEKRLNEYFEKEAVQVFVQLSGIRFSVVGDVNKPGKYVIYQNQVNIFEALAQAGDITLVGNRQEVQIIRQNPEGISVINLDLTNSDVLRSGEYFIQPNDVINVKPLAVKSLGIGATGFQTFASILGVLASTATLIFTLTRIE